MLAREHTTHHETIGDRFAREQRMLPALPTVLPRPCVTRYARVNKFAEVGFERNWRLRIIVDADVVAEHQRGFGAGERFLDPRHYLTLLAHKHRAAESALVLSDGRIPDVLRDLFDRYCQTDSRSATKRWTQVLSLLSDVPVAELAQVVVSFAT